MLSTPAVLMRCGIEMRMAIAPTDSAAPALVDPTLVKWCVRSRRGPLLWAMMVIDAGIVALLITMLAATYFEIFTGEACVASPMMT